MKKAEINFREADESDYGWAYLKPYMEKHSGKPLYVVLEQIFREHELYKGIAESILTLQSSLDKQLADLKKETHFTLLRAGDAEKSARTLLHLANNSMYVNDVTDYLPMAEMVTPPVEKATREVQDYYTQLSLKKRSRMESSEVETDRNNESLALEKFEESAADPKVTESLIE
ncbi:hypothetical protein [Enterococcus gilvus]|uniref:Uncharacterized protein n=1 Tax=Enterococcus gilvus ATCC BAA-350 TaxID=1158614 RepID=R2V107_9ENTE|nr:hypothetical protein [Enterococcus gilvus]EOI51490.1 hypothetical protein UKC_04165 [Enterococcus gilvus ATCC BAA-350]EOW77199.1 hypothetical protein I592_04175 [Enterococcus gilvus ATCC BAA-350]